MPLDGEITEEKKSLTLEVSCVEVLKIECGGDSLEVRLEKKSGQRARLRITASEDVSITKQACE